MNHAFKKAKLFGLMAVGLAAISGQASAQSNVTVYGIVDVGVEAVNHVGSTSDTVSRVSSGSSVGSRLGFRGSEDLGGGLKAIFNLENGFNGDTGTLAQGGRMFGRAAFVGLEGSWGSVKLGRQINTFYELGPQYDPVSYSTYGLMAMDSIYVGRADNSVKYSYKQGGLSTSVMYSLGRDGLAGTPAGSQSEVPGNSRVGREIGVNVNYATGALKVGFAYDQQNGVTVATQSDTDQRWMVAATYDLAKTTRLYGGFQQRDNDIPGQVRKTNLYWIGAKQSITAPLAIAAGLYHIDPKDSPAKASLLAAALTYDFSKRTTWYLNVGYAKNSGGYTQGVLGATGPNALATGDSQTGIASGIVHRF